MTGKELQMNYDLYDQIVHLLLPFKYFEELSLEERHSSAWSEPETYCDGCHSDITDILMIQHPLSKHRPHKCSTD